MSRTVAALILAGGQSSRMGQDKALIKWHSDPLLHRVGSVASICCSEVYILTPWAERYQNISDPNWHFLPEAHPGQGPLVALLDGMTQLTGHEWILLLACDLPLLNPDILQGWIAKLSQLPSEQLACVPRQGQRWDPLCGLYRIRAQESLRTYLQQGGRSFQNWLNQIAADPLPVTPEVQAMLHNCNRPEDLPEDLISCEPR